MQKLRLKSFVYPRAIFTMRMVAVAKLRQIAWSSRKIGTGTLQKLNARAALLLHTRVSEYANTRGPSLAI
jgi:hypothetical protein